MTRRTVERKVRVRPKSVALYRPEPSTVLLRVTNMERAMRLRKRDMHYPLTAVPGLTIDWDEVLARIF